VPEFSHSAYVLLFIVIGFAAFISLRGELSAYQAALFGSGVAAQSAGSPSPTSAGGSTAAPTPGSSGPPAYGS
jgi:hypothetical protein